MKIKIPFNDWSLDKLRRRIKSETSRNKKYGKPGDRFNVDVGELDTDIRTYELVKVRHLTLFIVATYHWQSEGCESSEDFIDQWKGIHPEKGYDPLHAVWLHKFKEVKK